jgi:hypothetical protein
MLNKNISIPTISIFIFGLLTTLTPLKANSQSISCSSILKPGTELRYVASNNNGITGYGILRINSNPDPSRWSGIQINSANGGTKLEVNGEIRGSSFHMPNSSYGEDWVGICNSKGIAGKITNNVQFVMFKNF